MTATQKRGDAIRKFILENIQEHPNDIVTFTAQAHGLSRQAVNKHIQKLVTEGILEASGTTRNRKYALKIIEIQRFEYLLQGLQEHLVWRNDIAPLFSELPENVRQIWQYGVTEMVNNAIDHSSGRAVGIGILKTALSCAVIIKDNGEGIFGKIQRELQLDDERHAILELAKGKLTTDPVRHSGEGIFFSSRMFDSFSIHSGDTFFSHSATDLEDLFTDWIEVSSGFQEGTLVLMELRNDSLRTRQEVFDRFADDDYGFTKTIVPVKLAQYGDEQLISRSQAKRLLARFDRFKMVVLDFKGVESIGQAFADEVFRVFSLEHPEVDLVEVNANDAVQRMIGRARHHE